MAANGAQMMMNRNEKTFYLKACDGFGMVSSFKEFTYSEKPNVSEMPETEIKKPTEYVSREEFAELKAEIENLKTFNRKAKGKEDNVS